MINFRFHIVSLTAVLLALGVGLVLGTSFLDEAVVDALRNQLDGLEEDLDDSRQEAGQMRTQIASYEDEHEALDQELDQYILAGALADAPVLVISAEGIDGDLVPRMFGALESSGAQTLGAWELSGDLALQDEAQIERLGEAMDLSIDDPDRLRTQLVVDLGNVLFEVTDASLSADAPDTAALLEPQGVSPLQGEGEGSGDTGDESQEPYEPGVAAALHENGLIEYRLPEDAEADEILLPRGGVRVVILTGPGAEVPDSLLLDILGSVASNGRVPIVVPSVTETGEGEGGGEVAPSFLQSIRQDEGLAPRVSTVDNFERAAGKTATVLALQAASPGSPIIGHYGRGDGAEQLLPPPPPAAQ